MSVWRGTYNQEQHEPLFEFEFGKAHCNRCGAECSQERQCRCCMDSTIEALRAQVQAVREERDALKHDYDKSAAQVQRVREEVNGDQPIPRASDDLDNVAAYCAGYVDALRRVRRALEGDA